MKQTKTRRRKTRVHDVQVRRLATSQNAAVFRRGGDLRAKRRHGSHVRNVGGHESRALQVVVCRTWTTSTLPVFKVAKGQGTVGLSDWLKSLWSPRPAVRDLSQINDSSLSSAVTSETITRDVVPLKEGHQRLAIRDPRLLPKPKPKIASYVWPRPPRPVVIPDREARRLFSDSLRSRDRNIRDLLTDETQLQRYELPIWRSEQDVAAALQLTLEELQQYSIHRLREKTPHYVVFSIPKRSGGERLIYAPKQRLRKILRTLNQVLVSRLPVSPHAHGFLTRRSVSTNAEEHVGRKVILKMDIKDCFPSIHFGRVRGLLISLGYSFPVATCLAILMTEAPRQIVVHGSDKFHVPIGPRVCVQGAPTSPGICNAVLMRMDRRLFGFAKSVGFHYTRYADDLTFSGNDRFRVPALISMTGQIVDEEGFSINRRKTQIQGHGRRQQVTGVTVNDEKGLSRQERRRLRAAIHQLQPDDPKTRRHLEGKLAYLHMLNPQQALPLQKALAAVRRKE